mmetsp:Transcript_29499/g.80546  ORF Transcript_29499/g.80546 Transcript_29499/m.80546 type:complete len:360 (+) Transcript_29499:1267-2346(+)
MSSIDVRMKECIMNVSHVSSTERIWRSLAAKARRTDGRLCTYWRTASATSGSVVSVRSSETSRQGASTPSARRTASMRKPSVADDVERSRNCRYLILVMPPAFFSSSVAAEASTLSIFSSRSERSEVADASSSIKVRAPILMSIRHGRTIAWVRSSISMMTRLPARWVGQTCKVGYDVAGWRSGGCTPSVSLTSMSFGKKLAASESASLRYIACSASSVVLCSVPRGVRRKFSMWPEMTALRSSSSSTVICWYSSVSFFWRAASSCLTYGCCLMRSNVSRSSGFFLSIPDKRSRRDTSSCVMLAGVQSSGAVTISISFCWSEVKKGSVPVAIAWSVTPSAQTSAPLASYLDCPHTSGAV